MWTGAFIRAEGANINETCLAGVDASTLIPRGSFRLPVNTTEKLRVGDMATLRLEGGDGALKHET